ncbi:nickel pincer cofactor biosynthesis protein LarB [Chloroflexia bacterium SDU3-3]|nr:nickel pincer cofactor biosynthesis protein LarB [Chloroflexia bacterium SDU3-3]
MDHAHLDTFASLDLLRAARTGVPEVVYAENKTPEQTVAIAQRMLDANGRALISRVAPPTLAALEAALGDAVVWERFTTARTVAIHRPGHEVTPNGGAVGVLTAGTSDIPTAEEAAALCREMGCAVHTAYDVGVAGLHRLFEPLRRMLDAPVDAIIVAAGMDGALPSVVAGLVDVPVVGLPTAVGYGFGGGGMGALTSMLQTCAPGLAVVNIDNGIGAGAMAGRIAARAGAARRRAEETNGNA